MCHLATVHSVAERQTEWQTDRHRATDDSWCQ